MVSKEEEMKAEDELLNTENGAEKTENGEENGKPAEKVPEIDPMDEEHTTDFEVCKKNYNF